MYQNHSLEEKDKGLKRAQERYQNLNEEEKQKIIQHIKNNYWDAL